MLFRAAGEFATALNMFGTTPKAPLMSFSVALTATEGASGSTRFTCAITSSPSLMLGGGFWSGPTMAVVGPLSRSGYLPGTTLPGSDRLPDATLQMWVKRLPSQVGG